MSGRDPLAERRRYQLNLHLCSVGLWRGRSAGECGETGLETPLDSHGDSGEDLPEDLPEDWPLDSLLDWRWVWHFFQ